MIRKFIRSVFGNKNVARIRKEYDRTRTTNIPTENDEKVRIHREKIIASRITKIRNHQKENGFQECYCNRDLSIKIDKPSCQCCCWRATCDSIRTR